MKKVWIIERGQYSDYSVIGIFSSKENAEVILARIDQTLDKASIVERILDPGVKELKQGLEFFYVYIDKSVVSVYKTDNSFEEESISDKYGRFYCKVWAKDSEEAIEIAYRKINGKSLNSAAK